MVGQSGGDPAWLSVAGAAPSPDGCGRAAPNTHADSGGPASRAGRLCRGQRPGRSRYLHVPGSVAIRSCDGLTSCGRVQLGRAHGRGGSSSDSSLFQAALRWGSGGPWEGALAPNPLLWDSFALSPCNPPTHLRGAAAMDTAFQLNKKRARPASHPGVGLPGLRPRTPDSDSWSTDNGLSSLWLAPSAPVRRRLAGRAAAQCLTKRLTSNTSFVCNRW